MPNSKRNPIPEPTVSVNAMTPFLAYAKAAVVNIPGEYGGRRWLDAHDTCPYCRRSLSELGSHHRPAYNLVKANDPDFGPAFCMACGTRNAEPSEDLPPKRDEDGDFECFLPKRRSPARACLFRVAVCRTCGWWFVVEDADVGNNGFAYAYAGILEQFDVKSSNVPLEVLRSELPRRVDAIHDLNPRRMEDLVASILSGVYDCEVHQLGYTHDGGVDLLLLASDCPVAIQVRRRTDSNHTEGVSGIREFLGAALLAGHRDLIYVTTAARFSAAAKGAAHLAVKKELVASFELLSRRDLLSLLASRPGEDNWKYALSAAANREDGMPTVPDPFRISERG